MSIDPHHFSSAIADFREARRQAALGNLLSRLTGKSTELLSFDAVSRQLKLIGSSERGLHEIPLDAIAGSVGRANDYTRDFLPRRDDDAERWARVRVATTDPSLGGTPPIQVYQIGEVYFVIDGHHRISVARQLGSTHIQAYVTEIRTRASLSAGATPEDLIVRAEYAGLLETTRLDQSRPGCDVSVTVAGQCKLLEAQIRAQQEALRQGGQREVDLVEAAARWYDEVYLPVVYLVRELGLLRDFPNRTEADLYLMVSEHRHTLEQELGWNITAEAGAANLVAKHGLRRRGVRQAGKRLLSAMVPDELKDGPPAGDWRREKLPSRYSDRLFADILVPISGADEGWRGLEQALPIARKEDAQVHGLLVARKAGQKVSEAGEAARSEFDRRCAEAGVSGRLAIETGDVALVICERAALTDLVVLSLAHPPSSGRRARLGSGLRTIIRRSPRPLLAVPAAVDIPACAVLAYDGSPKSEEALFVATYLAEAWHTRLVVLTVTDSDGVTQATIDHARNYLEMHEVEATFVAREGVPAAAVLELAEAEQSQLIVLGGYGSAPVVEVVVGSQVDQVLRGAHVPVLICR